MVSTGTKILLSISSIGLGVIMLIGAIRSSGFLNTPNGGAIFGSFCFIIIGVSTLCIMAFNGILSSKLVQQNRIISKRKTNSPQLSEQERKTVLFGLGLLVFGILIYRGDGLFNPPEFVNNLHDIGFWFVLLGTAISGSTASKLLFDSNKPEGKQ